MSLPHPRRLLVSPIGAVHVPGCRRVPATAETSTWGVLDDVEDALYWLSQGESLVSVRRGTLPGPIARIPAECVEALEPTLFQLRSAATS